MSSFAARVRRALLIVLGGERLRNDPLFDSEWYRWAYPDAPRSSRAAARHYATVGGIERIPSVDFDPAAYAAIDPAIVATGVNPLVHYLRFGRRDGVPVQPFFRRFFADADERVDRAALVEFLRSGELIGGRASVLRALPHLLHAMPRNRARRFGAVLIALAHDRPEDLGAVIVSGPNRGSLDGVSLEITGEPGILATASLAALMVAGEVGREQVALPGDEVPQGDVRIEVKAGALVVPGSLARLVARARRDAGPVVGAVLDLDGTPLEPWHTPDQIVPAVVSAVAVPGPADQSSIGGPTAVWWPAWSPARHPAPRPRALLMDSWIPTPDRDSGSLCTVAFARSLTALGYRVVFVPQNLRWHPRYTPELESWGVEVVDDRTIDRWQSVLERASFELALLVRPPVFDEVADEFRAANPDAAVIFAPLDLHHMRLASHAAVVPDPVVSADAERMRAIEVRALNAASATIVLSTTEVQHARTLAPSARVELVPMARDREAAAPIDSWSHRTDLVFVGSYRHLPNPDAVRWFVDEVWPNVESRLPEARFVAYGSGMPDDLRALASERVVMHGYVEHLADAFATARLAVVPLRFGAGVKGKVTSTMLGGIPVVSTPVGVEGMDLPGDAVVVAHGASALADAIVELWHDEPRLSAISAAALDVASTRFSFEAQRVAIAALLDSLAAAHPES